MKPPRVLLADDHTLLLEAFRRLLEPQCNVVGTVADGRALLEAAQRLTPDVIVLDIAMPQLNGLDAAWQIKQTSPDVKLIFLTVNDDQDLVAEALRHGASGYLLKSSAASELVLAIKEALAERTYVTPQVRQGVFKSLRDNKMGMTSSKLTPRQREILQLLVEGRAAKEIAAALYITPRTVWFHKYKLMKDHGLKTGADLIRFAAKHHIVPA